MPKKIAYIVFRNHYYYKSFARSSEAKWCIHQKVVLEKDTTNSYKIKKGFVGWDY